MLSLTVFIRWIELIPVGKENIPKIRKQSQWQSQLQ